MIQATSPTNPYAQNPKQPTNNKQASAKFKAACYCSSCCCCWCLWCMLPPVLMLLALCWYLDLSSLLVNATSCLKTAKPKHMIHYCQNRPCCLV